MFVKERERERERSVMTIKGKEAMNLKVNKRGAWEKSGEIKGRGDNAIITSKIWF